MESTIGRPSETDRYGANGPCPWQAEIDRENAAFMAREMQARHRDGGIEIELAREVFSEMIEEVKSSLRLLGTPEAEQRIAFLDAHGLEILTAGL